MIDITWTDLIAGRLSDTPAAVTVGVFDGVHDGHRALISRVTGQPGIMAVVVTFNTHPTELLAPHKFPGLIMTPSQKLDALRIAGVDIVVEIDFTRSFSELTGEQFLSALLGGFDLRSLAVGYDFRCGRETGMDGPAVRDWMTGNAVSVELVGAVRAGDAIVSSTLIRRCLRNGDMRTATKLLGRPWRLDLSGADGTQEDGFTIYPARKDRLMPPHRQILPAPGTYPVSAVSARGTTKTTATIDEISVRLPLAAGTGIRYIVLQEHRV